MTEVKIMPILESMNTQEKMLRITQVAAMYNVSLSTVRRLIAEDKIRAIKIRNSWRIYEQSALAYLHRSKDTSL